MVRWGGVVALAASLLVACEADPVDCVIDGDCAGGLYCVATRCVEPVPLEDDRQAYIEQVAPLIETGCNCHGPGSGRPWSYEHRFDDPAALDAELAVLRQWLYNPLDAGGATTGIGSRPVAWGYGLAACGFNHPGIYEGPTQPQYLMLVNWAAQARGGLRVLGPADVDPPAAEPPPDGPLPEVEQAALAAIGRLGYRAGMAQEIVPRLVGQCGCCHSADAVSRRFKLGGTEADLEADIAQIEGYVSRASPDQSGILRYGLGAQGRGEAHPQVYSGVDDPRYRLLRAWIVDGPPPE